MIFFVLLLTIVAVVTIFVSPKTGSVLIWPILFTYPHNWWSRQAFLILNIGVDDLFCILVFVAVVLRRHFGGGIKIRYTFAFWTISAFTVIAAVANLAGYSQLAARGLESEAVKNTLKVFIFWGLFYAILHCIDDERDLRLQFTAFTWAAAIG